MTLVDGRQFCRAEVRSKVRRTGSVVAIGAYVTYTLNLWGPMARMTNAASQQALEVGKERLREFLESSDTGRQAMAMSGRSGGRERDYDEISMETLNGDGKKRREDEDDLDDI